MNLTYMKVIFPFLPPSATGYMIGEQHFITFDQRHFEYKGRCQHLLVADMVGGQWAVAVNYHHHSSRTIIIYVHDSYIEIAKDFRVSCEYANVLMTTIFLVTMCQLLLMGLERLWQG